MDNQNTSKRTSYIMLEEDDSDDAEVAGIVQGTSTEEEDYEFAQSRFSSNDSDDSEYVIETASPPTPPRLRSAFKHLRRKVQRYRMSMTPRRKCVVEEPALTSAPTSSKKLKKINKRGILKSCKTMKRSRTLPDQMRHCRVCMRPCDLSCGGCFQVVYCSEDHQLEDWVSHRITCCHSSVHRMLSVLYQGPFRVVEAVGKFVLKNGDFQMTALCDIPAGEKILEEKPFLIAPWPRLKLRKSEVTLLPGLRSLCLTCFGCCKVIRLDFWQCVGCNLHLCSDKCKGMTKHLENECGYMKKMQIARGLPDEFDPRTRACSLQCDEVTELLYEDVMMLRLILAIDRLEKNDSGNIKWADYWAKLNATWKIDEDKRSINSKRGKLVYENMEASLPLSYLITEGNKTVIWNLFCIIEGNALALDLPFRRFRVLCTVLPLARHSCAPNSHAFLCPPETEDFNYEDITVMIQSGIEIEKGEPVTISYCPLILPTTERRLRLFDQYFFWCECKRCNDITELGTFPSGIKCSFCPRGYLVPPDSFISFPPPNSNAPALTSGETKNCFSGPAYFWRCSDGQPDGAQRCESFAHISASKSIYGTPYIMSKVDRLELESVRCVGLYNKTINFENLKMKEYHHNHYIMLKLYDDILRGALYPLTDLTDDEQRLKEFKIEWLGLIVSAKRIYSTFMKKLCPAFDFQGFPDVNLDILEGEFTDRSRSRIISSNTSSAFGASRIMHLLA